MLRYAADVNLRVAGRDVWSNAPEEGAEGWRAKRNIRVWATSLGMPLEALFLYTKRSAEAKAYSADPNCPRLQQLPAAAPDMLAPAPQTVLGRSARGRHSRRLG